MRLMQLVALVYEEFDVIVDLSEVMGSEVTLAWIAGVVEQRRGGGGHDAVPEGPPGATRSDALGAAPGAPVPLSDLQLAFWDMRLYGPAMTAYNEGVSHLVEGDLDIAVCRKVLSELVATQPALRSAYLELNGVPVQREVPFAEIADALRIEVVDLSSHEDPMAECAAQHRAMYATQFDLSSPPCFRVVLWRVGERRWVVSWVVYHIVTDWWAVDVLRRSAATVYRAMMMPGGTSPQEPPRIVPLDPHAGTAFTADDRAYWLSKFETPPRPVDLSRRPRPAIKTYVGEMYVEELARVSAGQLDGLRERLSVTMSSLTFSAFCILLAATSGEDDVTVGVPFLNRQHASVQDAVGLFVNSLPVRLNVDGAMDVANYVRACHGELLEAFRHGRYPSYRLIREAKTPNRLNRAPLYEQLFSYYENTVVNVACTQTQLRVTEIELPRGTSKYDLSLFVTRSGDRLSCKAEYATALFAERDVADLVSRYQFVLERMIADPAAAVRELVSATRERAAQAGREPSAARGAGTLEHPARRV
ncbi:hypothetical protein BE18_04585 [Sorangium cellulosum]|uniref:Condensation domain-containing protein n=1 Tax=Sorangium cellulosum TaxID=56 RepID=A0A150SF10_SORCE|nr:hypothetical protein BE18_04585 [Sorangium cellulosum]